jgi:hypothetical protein
MNELIDYAKDVANARALCEDPSFDLSAHTDTRWSFTYTGDESLEHSFFRSLVTAFLENARTHDLWLEITVESATGERYTVCCVPTGNTKAQGTEWGTSSTPYVEVLEYFPETESVRRGAPIKVYLHQILNINLP